jgi:CheY-like chemotaxis protein
MSFGQILIVDDDADVRGILAEILTERGFDVVTARDGLEALRVVRTMPAPPSVILLDLMMPGMDGYGFLEERRQDAALAEIPVVVITAARGVDRERIGRDTLIEPKPFDLPHILGVLHHLSAKAGLAVTTT